MIEPRLKEIEDIEFEISEIEKMEDYLKRRKRSLYRLRDYREGKREIKTKPKSPTLMGYYEKVNGRVVFRESGGKLLDRENTVV